MRTFIVSKKKNCASKYCNSNLCIFRKKGPSFFYVSSHILSKCLSITARVCIYKGNMYQQGQQWQDGCNYNCECIDAMSGQYKCTEV